MNRHLVNALRVAWELPEFRNGVQHLVDLGEVTALLAALSTEDRGGELSTEDSDHAVERSALNLLRSALDTTEIREAVLLLLERDDVRGPLVAAAIEPLADRPSLATAIASAAEDPAVRGEVRAVLGNAKVRELVWQTADKQLNDHRFGVLRRVAVLFVRHPAVRRLTLALRRHGVIRELLRKR